MNYSARSKNLVCSFLLFSIFIIKHFGAYANAMPLRWIISNWWAVNNTTNRQFFGHVIMTIKTSKTVDVAFDTVYLSRWPSLTKDCRQNRSVLGWYGRNSGTVTFFGQGLGGSKHKFRFDKKVSASTWNVQWQWSRALF